MAMQVVMDRTGDRRHYFTPNDLKAPADAEQRFNKLVAIGFTAATRTAAGKVSLLRSFDPNAEETLFFPRVVGG
jgi:hypothetical protein